jgi:hypothetical protein
MPRNRKKVLVPHTMGREGVALLERFAVYSWRSGCHRAWGDAVRQG